MISILTCLLVLISVAQASTCYDNNGVVRPDMTPCDATAQTSACCITGDYCLSNGLCLNSRGNNLLGVHGCTDSNWGTPCVTHCNAKGGEFYSSNLFPCPIAAADNNPNTEPSYCCGPDPSSCCQNGGNFTVPVGTIVFRSGDPGSPTSSSSSSTGSTSPITTSARLPTNSPSTTTPGASTDSKSLAIGLGVGITLGVALIGAIIWFTLELRRYNVRHVAVRSDTSIYNPSETQVLWRNTGTYELDGGKPIHELFSGKNRAT